MADSGLLIDFLLILSVAFALGFFMQRIGQPVVLGYLLTGLLLGPGSPGPVVDPARVDLVANIGVTLLMFSLGVQFSFRDLFDLRRLVTIGGGVQVGLTLLAGLAGAMLFGFGIAEAFLLGAVASVTSSTIALKLLQLRGELDQPQARATLGISLAQDLAVVPLLAILPAIAGDSGDAAGSLLRSIGFAVLVLLTLWLMGLRLVPWFLFQVARIGSRELFLVTIVLIAFGVALFSEMAGLSLAFGAFLAGVVISESEFSHQVLGEIIPLRDVFAVVFFASIGLLFDPRAIINDWQLIGGLLLLIVVGKITISAAAIRLLGYTAATAASAGILLGQIGEFSFIIAGQGIELGIIDDRVFNAILAGAVGSLLINPVLIRLNTPLTRLMMKVPASFKLDESPGGSVEVSNVVPSAMRNHVVVAGFGRAGRELVRALKRRGFRFVVIDLDATTVRGLRERGIPAIYGDVANENVLQAAGVAQARVLAVTVPDLLSAQLAIRLTRQSNDSIDIISRAQSYEQIQRLDEAGATEVVQPAFEVGLEFVRHTLHRFGVSLQEIQALVSARRLDYYDTERHDEDFP